MKFMFILLILSLLENGIYMKRKKDIQNKQHLIGHARIYGGNKVKDIKDFPFTGIIMIIWNTLTIFYCSCTKFHLYWAITAANCINNDVEYYFYEGQLQIRGNTTKWKMYHHDDHVVTDLITHPEYNYHNYDNDVALLKVRTPFDPMSVIQLTPDRRPYSPGRQVIALGWGTQQMDGFGDLVDDLFYVSLKVQDWDACQRENKGLLTETQFCAGTKYHGPCTHDNGGPVFQPKADNADNRRYLVGIVSYNMGNLCGVSPFTTIYTDLNSVNGWIQATLLKNK